MARRRPPVVGIRGAGEVRLSKRLKRRLQHRAAAEARAVAAPEIRALKRQRERLSGQQSREIQGIQNAVQIAADAAPSGKQLRRMGLHGQALQQAAYEFAARGQDYAQAVPMLAADVRADYRDQRQALQADITSAKIAQKQGAVEGYYSALDEARTDAEAAARRRADRRADQRQDQGQFKKDTRTAVRIAMNLLATGALNSEKPEQGVPWHPKAIKHYGSEDNAWRRFEELLANEEDVDHRLAAAAVKAVRKRVAALNKATKKLVRATTSTANTLGRLGE